MKMPITLSEPHGPSVCPSVSVQELNIHFFVMSLDFADVKNNENMSKGMTYRTHLALQLLYLIYF